MNNSLTSKEKSPSGEFIRFILFVLFIILPLRLFVIEPFVVSGESMYPTFKDKDYLLVDAITYRLEEPTRGDVVVFKYPLDPKRYFIKRIIALPGETISISGKVITIRNISNPNGFVLDESYLKYETDAELSIKLSADEYFVLGDNRPVSSDSHVWGPLNKKYLVGRPFVRLYPFDTIDLFPGKETQ